MKGVQKMEDKAFELMTKMYSEFSEFRKDMYEFKQDMYEFKKEMYEFKQDMYEFKKETKNDIIRLENKLDSTSKALFDGYRQTVERLNALEQKVDAISAKVEKQDIEIKVIKGAKSV